MSLNLFTRLGNLVRGFMSLFVSGLEQQHPEIAYENAINTMVEKYNKLKNATAGLIRLREDAADRLQKAQAQQHELSAMLEQAMAEGQDDIAVELIERKDAIDVEIASLQAEMEAAEKDVGTAKTALTEVKGEIAKLKAEKDRMLAKMQSAQARVRIQDQLEGLSVDAELRALENVRTGIKDTIAKAKLGDELRESDLDVRLKSLRTNSSKASARNKLEALKKERAGQAGADRTI
ncbi:MAG: PspA/IM30 family protein [Xanthomonadales bacterium]|nr:PspA/IM30 family protein [Xanthomonadales bacterium]